MARAYILVDGDDPDLNRETWRSIGTVSLTNDDTAPGATTWLWQVIAVDRLQALDNDDAEPPALSGATTAAALLTARHNGRIKVELIVDAGLATQDIHRVDILFADPFTGDEIRRIRDVLGTPSEQASDSFPGAVLNLFGPYTELILARLKEMQGPDRNTVREYLTRAWCTREQVFAAQGRVGFTKMADVSQNSDGGIPQLWEQYAAWREALFLAILPQYKKNMDYVPRGSLNARRIRH